MDKVYYGLCEDICAIARTGIDYIFEKQKIDNLPLYLFTCANNCYIKYDTEHECITDISIRIYNRGGIVVDIEPLNYGIVGYINEKKYVSKELCVHIADTICACVDHFWRYRLETEGLCTVGIDDRYIAADLLA